MTNRELLRANDDLLNALDKQRLFLLQVEGMRLPCPACQTPVSLLEAAGIDLDAYDFGATEYTYRCPACRAELEQTLPALTAGGNPWHWRLKPVWLQEELRKAEAFGAETRSHLS